MTSLVTSTLVGPPKEAYDLTALMSFRRNLTTMARKLDLAHPTFPSSTAVAGNVVAWPGITHETTSAVRDLIERNDRQFHIWMKVTCAGSTLVATSADSLDFHNHLPHHLLTAYSMGATKKHLHAIFDAVKDDMAPLDPGARDTTNPAKTPEKIDVNSWRDARWLGSKE